LIKYVEPVFPAAARASGVRGLVIVEARIDEAGAVVIARVLESIPLLDEAALAAVRQWRFAATTVNGKPAAIIARIPVTFVP
jgi:periplasmic protein TonB